MIQRGCGLLPWCACVGKEVCAMRDRFVAKYVPPSVRWLRDDLPQMRWPLVVLTTVIACLLAGLASSFRGAALLLSFPFLVLSVMAYSALILLWRHVASLAVTGGIALAVLAFGGHWLTAAAFSCGLLAVSYVYASLFLRMENRFVRVATTAFAVGICGVLAILLYVGWHYDTLQDAIDALCHMGQRFISTKGTAYTASTLDALLHRLVTAVPALYGMLAILFAGLCDGAMQLLFYILDCSAYFTPEADDGITSPRSFAVLYAVLLFLVITTDSQDTPQMYAMLSNCHFVFALPCFWVGLTGLWKKLGLWLAEHALYKHTPSPLLMLVCFALAYGLLGLSLAFTVTAIVGAVSIFHKSNGTTEDPA